MFKIVINGDLRGKTDPRLLEGFLKKVVEDASGEPVARVTYHGLVRNRIDDLREAMQQQGSRLERR